MGIWKFHNDHLVAVLSSLSMMAIAAVSLILRTKFPLWFQGAMHWIVRRRLVIGFGLAIVCSVLTTLVTLRFVEPPSPSLPTSSGEHQIEAWTPTVKVLDTTGIKDDERLAWTIVDVDHRLTRFTQEIGKDRTQAIGFRRHDIIGKGDGPIMAGARYFITITNQYTCTDFFTDYYVPIWHPGRSGVYYEVNGIGEHWHLNGKCFTDRPAQ
jgi:hypothetical protein